MFLLTWESQVYNEQGLPFRSDAHKRQVNVQQQEEHTCQEANHADANSVTARRVILVEDALGLRIEGRVDVSLCGDAGKHHHAK